jgi:hypothetical protein
VNNQAPKVANVVGHAPEVVYHINAADVIEDVNDAWAEFALANDAPALATEVIGRSIWDYIVGPEVRQIYGAVFQRLREGQDEISFPFRCDSPRLYRAMRLTAVALDDGGIEFRSVLETIRAHPRELEILSRSSNFPAQISVPMCSWCKAIAVRGEWRPLEKAIDELRLFIKESPPRVRHDLCDACRTEYMQDYTAADAELTARIQALLPFIKWWFR